MTATELRESFFANPALREEWNHVTRLPSYHAVVEMLRAECVEDAAPYALAEQDVIAARRAFKLQAQMDLLQRLAVASHSLPVPAPEPEPWSHIKDPLRPEPDPI